MTAQHKLPPLTIQPAPNSAHGEFVIGPEIHSTISGAAKAAYAMGAAAMADMLTNALKDKRDTALALDILNAAETYSFYGRRS